MQTNKFQFVSEKIVRLEGVHSVGVIGDPGCEGLGTYNMKVYAGALKESAKDDITLIAGDLVPVGKEHYYKMIQDITEKTAENPVYVLRGNHDTGEYETYFGRKNYALLTEDFALVVLDNALRKFDEEGLSLLKEVLGMEEVNQAMIAFHIPVPNHFIANSVSEEEFEKLKSVYQTRKEKVKYLLCGHVHSRFVDEVDAIPLICTGGGGALIEDVSSEIRACDVEHHIVHFSVEHGKLNYRIANLSEDCYSKERKDRILKDKLLETVQGEMMAHLRYLMFADRARRRGMDKIASLFEALADSEYCHARSFYSVLENPKEFSKSVETFVPGEEFEYTYLYKILEEYAKEHQDPLAAQAYAGAAYAEKTHARLLKEASDMEAFTETSIYVCPICGCIMTGEKIPDHCPVCGGPKRQYREYTHES